LILDNARRGKHRSVRKFNKDQIFLTRVLRRDGNYWFALENRAANKREVERLLAKLGVDPDNMLIIMHQNMVEQFTVLSPQEKLQMVEAAVGLEPYRRNVLQALKKLTHTLSQEESVNKLLESAEQTLNYWREQYDRYQEKKQLMTRRRFLERELAWAEASTKENIVKELDADRRREEEVLNQIENEAKDETGQLQIRQSELLKLKDEWKRVFSERLSLERQKAKNESTISLCEQLLRETTMLETAIQSLGNPSFPVIQLADLKKGYEKSEEPFAKRFRLLRSENLKELTQNSSQQLSNLNKEINENQVKAENLEEEIEKVSNQVIDDRIRLAILQYRKENVTVNLERLSRELRDATAYLDEAVKRAKQTGPRIAVIKGIGEILDEIRVTDGHLAALSDVSEDIERMYESYSKLYLELKEKARLVAENREKALQEVKARMQAWRTVIQSLLEGVSLQYQNILAQAQAVGEVRLVNGNDIEAAGLEILVGFKGGKPVPLDSYTQSGGERTTATISFLLALQQHVRSPFRAVDEYDIHMDPKNREVIANMLVSTVKDDNAQYVVITPSQVTLTKKEVNIITVQNVEGTSIIREVA
jgi:chromosome segregation ATPase